MDIWNAVLPLLTAFGGAYFGAWLNRNRYYQEKWWDRKAEIYDSILSTYHELSEILMWILAHIKRGELGKEITEGAKLQGWILKYSSLVTQAQLYLPHDSYELINKVESEIGQLLQEYDLRNLSDVTSEKLESIGGAEFFNQYSGLGGFGGKKLRREPLEEITQLLRQKKKELSESARKDLKVNAPFTRK